MRRILGAHAAHLKGAMSNSLSGTGLVSRPATMPVTMIHAGQQPLELPADVLRELSSVFTNSRLLTRAIVAIETLARHPLPVDRLTLAREAGASPVALDRVLLVLVEHGFVLRTGRFGTSLGPRLLHPEARFPPHLRQTVSPLIAPYLAEFAAEQGAPAFLAIPAGERVIVTDAIGGTAAEIERLAVVDAAARRAVRRAAAVSEESDCVCLAAAPQGPSALVAPVTVSTSFACVGTLYEDSGDRAAASALFDLSQRLTRALGRRFPKRG